MLAGHFPENSIDRSVEGLFVMGGKHSNVRPPTVYTVSGKK